MIENKDLLMSIQPQWVYKICNRIKTIEVRKTKAKHDPKFRIFVYCTKGGEQLHILDQKTVVKGKSTVRPDLNLNGKIVGHCTCTEIREFRWDDFNHCYDIDDDSLAASCLTQEQLYEYGKGQTLYGYVLSTFMMYCAPCDISEAYQKIDEKHIKTLKTAPQSWGYIHGVGIVSGYTLL